jgi:ABC-2 type transport system permease protein
MAVYEQTYKPYDGPTTAGWSRFLVIPRRAFKNVFRSKFFTAFYALCFVPTLIFLIIIYFKHNVTAMAIMDVRIADLVPIDALFFRTYIGIQSYLALLITIAVGPGLISSDISNNALPLYLARPISRAEYALGKMTAVFALLSAVTWIPGLVLYALAAYLEGWSWFVENIRTGGAIFAGAWAWIVTVTLVALATSTVVRQSMAARGTLVGIFFALSAFGGIVNESFDTTWGYLVSLVAVSDSVWISLFGDATNRDLPAGAAWTVLVVVCVASVALLSRRIRAYEVVS